MLYVSLRSANVVEKMVLFVLFTFYSLLLVRKVDQQIEYFGEIRVIYHVTKNLFQLEETVGQCYNFEILLS